MQGDRNNYLSFFCERFVKSFKQKMHMRFHICECDYTNSLFALVV